MKSPTVVGMTENVIAVPVDAPKIALPTGTEPVDQLAPELKSKVPGNVPAATGVASQVASCARPSPGSAAANVVVANSAAIRRFRRCRAGKAVGRAWLSLTHPRFSFDRNSYSAPPRQILSQVAEELLGIKAASAPVHPAPDLKRDIHAL